MKPLRFGLVLALVSALIVGCAALSSPDTAIVNALSLVTGRSFSRLTPEQFARTERLKDLADEAAGSLDMERALTYLNQSITYAESIVGPSDAALEKLYSGRAAVYEELAFRGDAFLRNAERDYQRALELSRKFFAREPARIAFRRGNLARVVSSQGRYPQARALYEEALKEHRNRSSHGGAPYLFTVMTFAQIACENDEVARCGELVSAAKHHAGTMAAVHPDDRMEIDSAESLYASKIGEYGVALDAGNRVLARIEAGSDLPDALEKRVRERLLLQRHAAIAEWLGSVDEARRTYRLLLRGLEPYLAQPRRAPPVIASMAPSLLNTIARGYVRLDRGDEAASMARTALAFPQENTAGRRLTDARDSWLILAKVAEKRRDYEDAARWLRLAVGVPNSCASHHAMLAAVEARRQQRGAAETALETALQMLAAHRNCADDPEWQVFEHAARYFSARGVPAAAIAMGKMAIGRIETTRESIRQLPPQRKAEFVAARASIYYEVAAWLVDQQRPEEAQQVLDLLNLEELSEFTRGASPPALGTRQILVRENERRMQEAASGTVLPRGDHIESQAGPSVTPRSVVPPVIPNLDRPLASGDVAISMWKTSDRVVAQIRTSQGLMRGYFGAQFDGERLFGIIYALDYAMRHRTGFKHPTDSPRVLGKQLYDVLWAPIADEVGKRLHPGGTVHLHLHGELRLVPFAALFDGKRYLIERHPLVVVTTDAARVRAGRARPSRLAAFASTVPTRNLSPLAYADDEVRTVLELAGGPAAGNRGFVNPEFRRDTLFAAFEGPSYSKVHIASHFVVTAGGAASAYLVLGDGSVVSAEELQRLSLSGLQLLVLSACQTAAPLRGALSNHSELVSLGSVMVSRGAQTVIGSLWPVQDKTTPVLMKALYEELREKPTAGIAHALQAAQISMLDDDRDLHPYYWAPFMVLSDGRER